MRLDKFLAGCGYGTRREVKALVKSGAVSVNGVTERDSGQNVSESDNIMVGGNSAVYKEFVYIMLNKPQGYVSATEDRHYPVVTELIGEEYARFKPAPVGRLDIDTEGLLLLTNDGDLNHRLTSPSKHVDKTYFAVLNKPTEASDTDAFAAGMEFKDFTARSAKLKICENRNEVFVTISEGKYHQVKRMCERVGKKVTYLKRISMGGLKLDPKLAPGEYRELTPNELEMLN